MNKVVIIGVLFLFIINSVNPIAGFNLKNLTTSITHGNTLYVGGDGPGNYTKIQDAIDDANEGDTVYVYNGKYIENLIINKSINLVGKNKNTTIIYGNNTKNVIYVCADGVTFKGFTVRNSKNNYTNACILICSNSNLIKGNTILGSNHHGIIISNSKNNTISDTTIMYHNHYGIFIEYSNNTRILRNTFYSNLEGCISADEFNNLTIIGNDFRQSWFIGWDISLYGSICTIKRNNFYSTSGGIYLPVCSYINVTENNFMNEGCKVCFLYFLIAGPFKGPMMSKNNFIGNYWYKPRYMPKPILGYYIPFFILFFMFSIQIPCFHYDWHPAQEPYNI